MKNHFVTRVGSIPKVFDRWLLSKQVRQIEIFVSVTITKMKGPPRTNHILKTNAIVHTQLFYSEDQYFLEQSIFI